MGGGEGGVKLSQWTGLLLWAESEKKKNGAGEEFQRVRVDGYAKKTKESEEVFFFGGEALKLIFVSRLAQKPPRREKRLGACVG